MTLEQVYRDHRERVLVWALLARVPEADLEDVVHDVFLALETRLADVAPESVVAWLRTATGYVARRHRAKLARRAAREIGAEVDVAAATASPEQELASAEVRARLHGLASRLERMRRETLLRHVVEEVPFDRIAADHGVPFETARKRMRLARHDLARAIERERAQERRRTGGEISFGFLPLWRREAFLAVAVPLLAVPIVLFTLVREAPMFPAAVEDDGHLDIEMPQFQAVFMFAEAPAEREQEGLPVHARVHRDPKPANAPPEQELPERALVDLARRSLADGSPDRARVYLARARRAYPAGSLAPERAALEARTR